MGQKDTGLSEAAKLSNEMAKDHSPDAEVGAQLRRGFGGACSSQIVQMTDKIMDKIFLCRGERAAKPGGGGVLKQPKCLRNCEKMRFPDAGVGVQLRQQAWQTR